MYIAFIYLLIFLVNLSILTSGILFEYQLRCPYTPEKWRKNSDSYVCRGDKVYHCMQDQDGRYVVFCASSIWIQSDYCPEFNVKATTLIDVILCRGATEKCPDSGYLSNTVYQYPSCFWTESRSTRRAPLSDNGTLTTITKTRYMITELTKPSNKDQRSLTVTIVDYFGIIFGIIVPIAIFLAIIFLVRWLKRWRTNKKVNGYCYKCAQRIVPRATDQSSVAHETESYIYDSDNSNKEEDTEISCSVTSPFLEDSAKDNYKETRTEETFVIPISYKDAVQILEEYGFIIIVGGPGSGKTTFANYMVKENFTGFTVNYMKPKQTTLPELTNDQGNVVVWDDCFGIWNVCNLEENERANVRNTVMNLIDNCKNKENHKAIICIDSTFVEKQLKDEIRRNIFNLSEAYRTQLSRERFRNMFDRRIYFSNISEDVGFPLLVKLIVEDHCPIEQTEEFMKNPIPKLNENFHDLFQKDRDMYVTLVYVLCNTPSVNQREIDWKAWVKLRDECASKDDGSNNQQQKRSYEYSQLEEAKNLAKGRNLIYKNPKCIELNSTLLKYLEKTENQDVFAFRHHFLAQLLLCFHNEKVGSNGILEVANEEIKSVVKRLQSSI